MNGQTGGGAISGYVESVNKRVGWVNSAGKRRPLALSGERTCWPLVSPEGTGVAKGKSCLGLTQAVSAFTVLLTGPESLEPWSVERCNFKTFFHHPVLFPPSGVQGLLDG